MKHKHAELIKAWADGAEIEYYSNNDGKWYEIDKPSWSEMTTYRIKPEPKPDVYLYTYSDGNSGCYSISNFQKNGDNLKLIVDGETGKLKKAEVL